MDGWMNGRIGRSFRPFVYPLINLQGWSEDKVADEVSYVES